MSMFDPFKKLKLASAFLGVADDSARDETIELSELFGRIDLRGMRLNVERLMEQDGVRTLYESHYLPHPEPIDRMMDYGEGTLGYEVGRYFRAHRLRPIAPPAGFDFRDAGAYLALRIRMTHPVLHVLTEYDASPLGELALQSYYVGQLGNLISGVMISSALLHITRDIPDQLGAALEIMSEAYQRGQTAKPFLGMAWEELWSAQVPQLRELVDIVPRRSTVAQLVLEPAEPAAPAPTPASARRSSSLTGFETPSQGSNNLGGLAGFSGSNSLGGLAGFGSSSQGSSGAPSSSAAASLGGLASFAPPPSPSGSHAANSSQSSGDGRDRDRDGRDRDRDGRVEPRQHTKSQSSLLASFLALAEQENHRAPPETEVSDADPEPVVEQPPPQQPQPRARIVAKPPPPPPVRPPSAPQQAQPSNPTPPSQPAARPPAKPEAAPGFTIEEPDPGIQPAQPGDPDFF